MNDMNHAVSRRAWLRAAAAPLAAVVLAGALPAAAQTAPDWPSKPIRLVVPFPPGGGTDVMGRLVAQRLSEQLGQPVIVENVPGATGTIGSARVAKAEPDGHTLLLGISATHAIAPALFKDLPYQPLRDFVPIARIAYGGNLLVAHPSFPADNVQQLIALARRPGAAISYGSWGNGSGGHLAAESINVAAGTRLAHVPYKGVAPLLQDLAGGHVMLAMSDLAGTQPLLKAGKVKPLAVTGPRRSSALPNVPTLVEQGIPFDTASWFALFAPARTSGPVVERLATAMAAVLQHPEVTARIAMLGMEPDPISRQAFQKQIADDNAAWARLVQASGATAD